MPVLYTDEFEGPEAPVTGRVVGIGTWSGGTNTIGLDGDGNLAAIEAVEFFTPYGQLNFESSGFISSFTTTAVYVLPAPEDTIAFTQFEVQVVFRDDPYGFEYATGMGVSGDDDNLYLLGGRLEEATAVPRDGRSVVTVKIVMTPGPAEMYTVARYVDDVLIHSGPAIYGDMGPFPWPQAQRLRVQVTGTPTNLPVINRVRMASLLVEYDEGDGPGPTERPPAFWTNFRRTYEIR